MRIRKATIDDLPQIVMLLADDKLGETREDPGTKLAQTYLKAFERIHADPNQELVVVENTPNQIDGTLQLSFIQYLTYKGGIRAQIEAVRVKKDLRGTGLGKKMIEWAIERSIARGAHVVQLTTDKRRPDALQFYQKLGFEPTHEGMKLHLS